MNQSNTESQKLSGLKSPRSLFHSCDIPTESVDFILQPRATARSVCGVRLIPGTEGMRALEGLEPAITCSSPEPSSLTAHWPALVTCHSLIGGQEV